MAESPLHLVLTAKQLPGRYTLTSGNVNYPIDFRPETDVFLSDLLRRLPTILVGEKDPSAQLEPLDFLIEIGTRLWQALLPSAAPP